MGTELIFLKSCLLSTEIKENKYDYFNEFEINCFLFCVFITFDLFVILQTFTQHLLCALPRLSC